MSTLENLRRRLIIWLTCLTLVGTPAFALVPIAAAFSPPPPIPAWGLELTTFAGVNNAVQTGSSFQLGARLKNKLGYTVDFQARLVIGKNVLSGSLLDLKHLGANAYVRTLNPYPTYNGDCWYYGCELVWSGTIPAKATLNLSANTWTGVAPVNVKKFLTLVVDSPVAQLGYNKFGPLSKSSDLRIYRGSTDKIAVDYLSKWQRGHYQTVNLMLSTPSGETHLVYLAASCSLYSSYKTGRYTAYGSHLLVTLDDIFVDYYAATGTCNVSVTAISQVTGKSRSANFTVQVVD